MKPSILGVFSAVAAVLMAASPAAYAADDYAIGADLSFLKQAEDRGTVFKENGQPKPGLQIFKDHGYNWIRLRLFHTPNQLPNNFEYTLALAQAAKKLGFKFLLNYHYSDTWADPGKQFIPKAWEGKSQADMVQCGNEVSNGMLWPNGRLPGNWDNFAELMRAGINGVDAGRGNGPRPKIMIHIDKGGDWKFTKAFFDKWKTYGADFDVIGQSYYPWWHGTLLELRENLHRTAMEYDKDIILVEVAYNWRTAEYKGKNPPYPETPEGQREFLESVHQVVLATPNNRGKGIFWWEPAVAGRGGIASRGMFDAEGNVLPVITVFDKWTRR